MSLRPVPLRARPDSWPLLVLVARDSAVHVAPDVWIEDSVAPPQSGVNA